MDVTGSYLTAGGTLPSSLAASSYQAIKAMLALSPAAGTAMAADAAAGSTFDWLFTSGASGDAAFDFLREGRGVHFDPACVDAFVACREAVLAVRERYQDEDGVY